MNKLIYALPLIVSFPATAAVLNVEGTIQVNGQEVINAEGKWVGQTTVADSVNINDYFVTGHISTFTRIYQEFINTDPEQPDVGHTVTTEGSAVWDYTNSPTSWSETDFDAAGNVTFKFERLSSTVNQLVNKVTYGSNQTVTSTLNYQNLVTYPEFMEFNKSYTDISMYSGTQVHSNGYENSTEFTEVFVRIPLAILTNYSQGAVVQNKECVLFHQYNQYTPMEGQYRIACKGLGIVKIWTNDGNSYTLTSFQ